MNKSQIASKKKKAPMQVLFVILLLCILFLAGMILYYSRGTTQIKSFDTFEGHHVEIIEIGHRNLLSNKHQILMKIDGHKAIRFFCYYQDLTVPSDYIICTDDTEKTFRLFFSQPDLVWGCEFHFDASFQTLQYAACWDIEVLNEEIVLQEYNNWAL